MKNSQGVKNGDNTTQPKNAQTTPKNTITRTKAKSRIFKQNYEQ